MIGFFAVGFGCKGSRIKAQDSRKLQATSIKSYRYYTKPCGLQLVASLYPVFLILDPSLNVSNHPYLTPIMPTISHGAIEVGEAEFFIDTDGFL